MESQGTVMQDTKRLVQIGLVVVLLLGCLFVLYPFLAAVLFAVVVCVTTWPLYVRLHARLRGRDTLAAACMTLILMLTLLVPTIFLAAGLGDAVQMLMAKVTPWVEAGLGDPPAWLVELPKIGTPIAEYWSKLADSREEVMNLVRKAMDPAREIAMSSIGIVGNGILQLVFVLFIGFFLYRDGHVLAEQMSTTANKLAGGLGGEMLTLSRNTVTGVMIGIVGTAFAQAVVAFLGFLVAGVPGSILLATATFFLSMIPVGPPLIWGGAAFWLYDQGQTGWAIFMALYGLIVISSVDNFVKPILISRTSSLPILLIALGVFGGILAFGFIGIFLGPTLLALGNALFQRWIQQSS